MSGFTHLHVASGFSMRYGASHPERLAERAAERGMDAVALTDRDSLAGAVRFAKAASAAGVRPLFGVDLAVRPATPQPGRTARRRTPVRGGAFVDESAPRVVFLARDGAAGWGALCGLVSAAHATGGGRPLLCWEDLAAVAASLPGGLAPLTVLLGPASDVGRALSAGRPDRAARLLVPWREVFGDALRLEAVWHGGPPQPAGPTGGPTPPATVAAARWGHAGSGAASGSGPGSLRLAARTVGFAAEQGVRPVLSNAVRYADPGQGPVADVLDAARRLVPVPRAPGERDGGERWLKGAHDMAWVAERIVTAAGFRRDAAYRLLDQTQTTAVACQVDPEDDLGLGRVHFPEPGLVGAVGRTAERTLRSRCAAAMVLRGHDRDRTRWERLEAELRTIERLGYASYFLTVARVVDDARELGVRVAARGSGAGSFVVHLLGVAHADPVAHGLLMERFLSVRRNALPDIDIDVESARRLDVYRAIFDRFGADRVATVAMPETYRVRHAVRDVGAALGMDPEEVDRLAKSFPHIRAKDARAALAELPELRGVAARMGDRDRLWDLVEALDGLPRGIAMHPCGVLLSDATLRARTPVVTSAGTGGARGAGSVAGFAMSQFDKDDVEELGLLKLDVLGVRLQSAMAHAAREVTRITGRPLDLDDPALVPPADPATYELIRSAETLGCFQIESPGQRDLIGRLQPSTFHDLVVDISLFRPGPVAADMVRPFIEARHGRRPPRYPHPDLAEALRETYGVVVFHEQVIEIMRIMTGCDRALADEARRALSNDERRGRVRAWFAREAGARGYASRVVARTWEIVEAFGSYGFCKAHAVAFAVPTYQSAWLKAHHPAAFYAGLLTHDPGMYPKRLLLADARRRGVPILPLDVNRSSATYRIELVSDAEEGVRSGRGGTWGVRLALGEVHGMSEAEAARIVAGQPYASVRDLWWRARPGRPVAERLAEVGALDAFGANRRDLLLHIAELHRQQRGPRGGGLVGQLPLDAGAGAAAGAAGSGGGPGEGAGAAEPFEPAGLPDLDSAQRLGAELDVLNMDVSRNLMDDHRDFLEELGVLLAERLGSARHGETVLVAGAKAATQTPPIRSGRRVIFTTLDDGTGLVDCAFFDDPPAEDGDGGGDHERGGEAGAAGPGADRPGGRVRRAAGVGTGRAGTAGMSAGRAGTARTGDTEADDTRPAGSRGDGMRAGAVRADVVQTGAARADVVGTSAGRAGVVQTGAAWAEVVETSAARADVVQTGAVPTEGGAAWADVAWAGAGRTEATAVGGGRTDGARDEGAGAAEPPAGPAAGPRGGGARPDGAWARGAVSGSEAAGEGGTARGRRAVQGYGAARGRDIPEETGVSGGPGTSGGPAVSGERGAPGERGVAKGRGVPARPGAPERPGTPAGPGASGERGGVEGGGVGGERTGRSRQAVRGGGPGVVSGHAACAYTVFHSWLLLVRGVVQRRGPRSLSVVGAAAWDLAELVELRRTGGLEAVAARLAEGDAATPDANGATDTDGADGAGEPEGADRTGRADGAGGASGGRRIQLANGYTLHPWADLQPAGERAATGRKLWHSSPGSAG
ncbi:DNA polymerase III subunit alpha [Streptomyces sp. NPDC057702]|uniref:DNA polymerase III subunit alpha n=1 Tax=unclassified Streptomyces TaxID=2593676 RepID=UPI0036CAADF7